MTWHWLLCDTRRYKGRWKRVLLAAEAKTLWKRCQFDTADHVDSLPLPHIVLQLVIDSLLLNRISEREKLIFHSVQFCLMWQSHSVSADYERMRQHEIQFLFMHDMMMMMRIAQFHKIKLWVVLCYVASRESWAMRIVYTTLQWLLTRYTYIFVIGIHVVSGYMSESCDVFIRQCLLHYLLVLYIGWHFLRPHPV